MNGKVPFRVLGSGFRVQGLLFGSLDAVRPLLNGSTNPKPKPKTLNPKPYLIGFLQRSYGDRLGVGFRVVCILSNRDNEATC